VHSVEMQIFWMINIGNGNGSSLWDRQQSKNMEASGPCAPHLLNPKLIGFDRLLMITTTVLFGLLVALY